MAGVPVSLLGCASSWKNAARAMCCGSPPPFTSPWPESGCPAGRAAACLLNGIKDNLRTLRVAQLAAVNLRLPGDGRVDALFDDQLAAMVAARDEGLIAGIGLSNVSLGQLRHAAARTDIVCVQNLFHLADRSAAPVLSDCLGRGRPVRITISANHQRLILSQPNRFSKEPIRSANHGAVAGLFDLDSPNVSIMVCVHCICQAKDRCEAYHCSLLFR